MKKLLILFLIILLYACSSDNNNETPETNNPDTPPITGTTKLIKQVVSQKFEQEHNGYYPDQFVYTDEKLVKALFYGCSGTMYQFEYGSNGKIETYYHKSGFHPEDLSTDISGVEFVIVGTIKYDSQNRVIEQSDSRGFKIDIEYDQNSRISKMLVKEDELRAPISLVVEEFDKNGNPIKINSDTCNYDDKVNPMYVLFNEFGIFYLQTCNSLDNLNTRSYFNSPSNPKEHFEDGKLTFSAIYEYDQDGYPTKATYTDSNSSIPFSDVDTFSYN
ncbi:hypothetical protein [Aquimarina macrocephali]|uniref:hypothetical protein n=1 Tax=Aquimarina macrocephali TaxID=666563 RepID=UPI003F6737E6